MNQLPPKAARKDICFMFGLGTGHGSKVRIDSDTSSREGDCPINDTRKRKQAEDNLGLLVFPKQTANVSSSLDTFPTRLPMNTEGIKAEVTWQRSCFVETIIGKTARASWKSVKTVGRNGVQADGIQSKQSKPGNH